MKLGFRVRFRGRQKAKRNKAPRNNNNYNYLPGMPLLTKRLRAFGGPLKEGLAVEKKDRMRESNSVFGRILRRYEVYLGDERIGKFEVEQGGLVIGRVAVGRVKRSYNGVVPSPGLRYAVIETDGLFLWDGLRILTERARVSASNIAGLFRKSQTKSKGI